MGKAFAHSGIGMQDRDTHGEDGASTAGYGKQFNELVEELRKDVEGDAK